MLRFILGIIILVGVLHLLAGCTVNLTVSPTPAAHAAVPPAAPQRLQNPCEVIICGLHPSRIA